MGNLQQIFKNMPLVDLFNSTYPGIKRDKTMADKLMYTPYNNNKITLTVV